MKNTFSIKDTTIVKGVALLFLLVHHCYCTVGRFEGYTVDFYPLTQNIVVYLAAFFKICVGMFVFLSAFGMTRGIKAKHPTLVIDIKDAITFTIRRYFTLWWNWIIIFVLCELFGLIYASYPIEVYGGGKRGILYFLIDALGLADLFQTPIFCTTWWYMSLAFLLIIIFPFLISLYKKYDILLLPLVIFLPKALGLTLTVPIIRWSVAIVLGIICADKDIFEKMKKYVYKNKQVLTKIVKFIILIGIFVIAILIKNMKKSQLYYDFNDGIIPMLVVYFCYEFINDIPILGKVLEFLGKHSMNIFLIHTLIRYIFFEEFIYGFGNAYLIVAVLLVISLLLSIVIEQLLKLIKYNEFGKNILSKLLLIINKLL